MIPLFPIAPALLPKTFMLAAMTVCPMQPAPKVEAYLAIGNLYYSEKHDSATLKTIMAKDKESTLNTDKRTIVMGVATSILDGNLQISYRGIRDLSSNSECIYVERAVFQITYHPAVFVSSQILDLPCTYGTVKAHEAQHLKIDKKALQEYLPKIQIEVMQYLRSLGYQGFGPYPASQTKDETKKIIQQIQEAGKPMAERMREARRKRQGEIDTPENYALEAAKCPQDRAAIQKKFGGRN